MSTDSLYLVPVVDVITRACETIAVSAPNESAAVVEVLRIAAHLRWTAGTIERVELNRAEQRCARHLA